MNDETTTTAAGTTATVEAPAKGHEAAGSMVSDVNTQMIVLTWITFGLLAALLYKVAWKPILGGLEKRENDIRKALDEAQKAREELAQVGITTQRMIADADAKAKEIVDAARKGAADMVASIQAKAREEAQMMVDAAGREIESARAKASASLRRECADLAIDVARKVLQQNLDEARSRALVDQLIHTV